MTVCLADIEVLLLEGKMLPQGVMTMIPFELEVKSATWSFWASHASESRGKKEVAVLAVVIDPDYYWITTQQWW